MLLFQNTEMVPYRAVPSMPCMPCSLYVGATFHEHWNVWHAEDSELFALVCWIF